MNTSSYSISISMRSQPAIFQKLNAPPLAMTIYTNPPISVNLQPAAAASQFRAPTRCGHTFTSRHSPYRVCALAPADQCLLYQVHPGEVVDDVTIIGTGPQTSDLVNQRRVSFPKRNTNCERDSNLQQVTCCGVATRSADVSALDGKGFLTVWVPSLLYFCTVLANHSETDLRPYPWGFPFIFFGGSSGPNPQMQVGD